MPLFVDPNTGKMQQGKSGAFTISLEDYNSQAESTEPTIGETFSGVVTESDAEKSARENRSNILQTSATQEIDEDAIRQRTTDNFQAEIDALEKVFNEKKRVEGIAGEGRLGESGAIQARRGLLGSDFGATQTESTRGFNTSKQDAITADKTLALSNIYNKIRASADSEINAKKLAKEAGSSNYLAFIRDTDKRKAGYVSATIKNFISSGNAPTDEDYNNIAGTLGVNVDNVKTAYKEQFDAQEVARQTQEALTKKTELETRETEAGISKTEAEALKLRAEAGDVEAQKTLDQDKQITDLAEEGWDYVETPSERDELITLGYRTLEVGERTYAKLPVADEIDTKITTAGGRTLLINTQTGETVKDLGGAYKTSSGGSGSTTITDTGNLSDFASDVFDNPALLNNLTATERGKVLKELSNSGADLNRFTVEDLSGSQREQVSMYDDLGRQASSVNLLIDTNKLNLGPIAGRVSKARALVGEAPAGFNELNSVLSNMGSTLLKLRSGAAVSDEEFKRLSGFIPSIDEDEKTVKDKVVKFEEELNKTKENYVNRATQTSFDLKESVLKVEEEVKVEVEENFDSIWD